MRAKLVLDSGEEFEITRPEVVLGRRSDCDVVLPHDREVSRRHARLIFDDGQWWIEDLGSRNGTFVNGHRLTARRPLTSGDRIRLGPIEGTWHLDLTEGPEEALAAPAPEVPPLEEVADPLSAGQAALEEGRILEAVEHLQRATRKEPKKVESWQLLARALSQRRRYAEAIEALEQALAVEPDNAAVLYNLGLAYEAAGRLEHALLAYEAALARDPEYAKARETLTALASALASTGKSVPSTAPCPQCARDLPLTVNFCYYCGAAVPSPAES
ncbi:MAG TPA: FHA domain-containing protein [Armatimonadetes bacterium]|nr:FHA domain-containing protein [Armatimonadota bacterium]